MPSIRSMRATRWCSAAAAALLVLAGRAGAQATPYVPLDDIAYRYADALIARGELRSLSLLERPYTAGALLAAADSALGQPHGPVTRSYAIALRTALQRYGVAIPGAVPASGNSARFLASGDVFATGATSGQREIMLADTGSSVTGGVGFRLALTAGPLVALVHPVIDNQLQHDPDFSGRKDRVIEGRTADAYVAGQWEYAELFVGRITRNWGPYALAGLGVGSAPYSYDHLFLRAGDRRAHVSALVARLEDAFEPDGVHARYFYSHRLGVRWRGIEVAVGENYVASGIGRSYEIALANPLNIYSLTWRNEHNSGNLSLVGDVAYRTRGHGVYAAQFFLDDLQIDRCATLCQQPSSYGMTFSAEGVPLAGESRVFASYTRLTGLAYRTPTLADQYSSFGVGLGRAFTDYDETRAGVDLGAIPYVTARLYAAFRRQGEGDYRLPYPSASSFSSVRGFLQGTVERVTRGGLSAAAMLAPGVEVTADVGVNRVTNAWHLRGVTRTRPEGIVRVQWTPRGLTF